MEERPLFGGALTISLPAHWLDVSNVRQVPDHQECWHDVDRRERLVIEILERQSDVSDSAAPAFFFQDLADANGCVSDGAAFCAASVRIDNCAMTKEASNRKPTSIVPNLPATVAVVVTGSGHQRIALAWDAETMENRSKGTQTIEVVQTHLAVVRLPAQATDLLVTLTAPLAAANGEEERLVTMSATKDGSQPFAEDPLFVRILSTLQIRDWSLFG